MTKQVGHEWEPNGNVTGHTSIDDRGTAHYHNKRLSIEGEKSGCVCQCYIGSAGYCEIDTGNTTMNPAQPLYDAEFPRLSTSKKNNPTAQPRKGLRGRVDFT